MLGILDDFLRFLGDLGAQKIWLSTAIVVATVIILSTTTTCQSILHLVVCVPASSQLRSPVEIGALSRLLKHLRHDILLPSQLLLFSDHGRQVHVFLASLHASSLHRLRVHASASARYD